MKFRIESSLFHGFPTLSAYVFRAERVGVALGKMDIKELMKKALRRMREDYTDVGILAASQLVMEWKDVYRQQNLKPSQFRSSIEALARRVVAEKPIEVNVPLVDFYNLHSIYHQACLGGYDMRKLFGNEIVLRFCDIDHDSFRPLGGVAESFPLNPNLAVYTSGKEILCWGFNCRDSSITALDENTDDVLFFAEAFTEGQNIRALAALQDMSEKLENVGASVSDIFSANSTTPCVDIMG